MWPAAGDTCSSDGDSNVKYAVYGIRAAALQQRGAAGASAHAQHSATSYSQHAPVRREGVWEREAGTAGQVQSGRLNADLVVDGRRCDRDENGEAPSPTNWWRIGGGVRVCEPLTRGRAAA